MPKKETANSVQQHTEAKLQFYTRYLELYLQVLLNAPAINKINIYDLYCGAGKYADGNTGSAIRAVDAIWKVQVKNRASKPINLHLNDLDTQKIENLKKLLANKASQEKRFSITYSSMEAFQFLEKLIPNLEGQDRQTRNLLFIDPYGYKDIHRDTLEAAMTYGRTEIVLFLPIEQMYRFKIKTLDDDVESSVIPLKHFIEQFELDVASIASEKDFINHLETALTFAGKYYATSYSIKNHTGHHYGMFFITSNLKGLEKIIEVKWGLDSQQGQGFSGHNQIDFFLETDRQTVLYDNILKLVKKGVVDNRFIYECTLNYGFMPKHANEILRKLCAEQKIHTIDANTQKPARKNTFKLSYNEYKSGKPAIIYRSGPEKTT